MTAGTATVMWIGELITDRGIGNGMSILIFTSIISVMPAAVPGHLGRVRAAGLRADFAVGVAVVALVVFVEQAQRRIPVQHGRNQVGRKFYGGASTYIPLKVNMAGVIPVIFASSILFVPTLDRAVDRIRRPGRPVPAAELPDRHGTVVPAGVRDPDHLLLLLLRLDHVQPDRSRGEPEQEQRVHPRHPAGQADRAVPGVRAVAA